MKTSLKIILVIMFLIGLFAWRFSYCTPKSPVIGDYTEIYPGATKDIIKSCMTFGII